MIMALTVGNVALTILLAFVIYLSSVERKRLVMAVMSRSGFEFATQIRAEKVSKVSTPLSADIDLVQVGL